MRFMITYRQLVGFSVLVMVTALSFAVAHKWRTPPPLTAVSPPPPPRPGLLVERPVITHTEDGQLTWQIQLKELQISHGGQNISARGVQEALIYGAGGKPVLRLTAQQVTGNTAQRDFAVAGNVQVVSYRGAVINTEKMQWRQAQQQIVCPGEVTLRSREAIIVTNDLTYNVNEDLVDCPNQVTMYAGDNRVVGRRLRYNVESADFTLEEVQMVFDAEEAKQKLREVRGE